MQNHWIECEICSILYPNKESLDNHMKKYYAGKSGTKIPDAKSSESDNLDSDTSIDPEAETDVENNMYKEKKCGNAIIKVKRLNKLKSSESSKKISKKSKILNTKSTLENQKQKELTHEYTPWERYSGDEKDTWLLSCKKCSYKTTDEELLIMHQRIFSHRNFKSKKRKKMTENSGNYFLIKMIICIRGKSLLKSLVTTFLPD